MCMLHYDVVLLQTLQGQEIAMNFALRYRGKRTAAGVNPGLIQSQTLTTYIQLVPNVPITCDGIGTKCSHHM